MAVYEVLVARTSEILQRWRVIVEGVATPDLVTTIELVDHMPSYLDAVIAALSPSTDRATEDAARAAGHGEQRLRLGFSLDSVVREYGAMSDAIIDTARAANAPMTFDELHSIFSSTINGIAHAVSEYSFQRDAELHRKHDEHTAFLAHELRSPLASAVTACEMLGEAGTLVATDRKAAALTRSLRRITDLVDHSLNAARASAGLDLTRTSTTLSAIITEARSVVDDAAEFKKIDVAVAVETDAPMVIDVRLVRSALGNLLHNAIKYTHTGGHVALRARVAGAHAEIEVEDGCGGIPPGALEQLFMPFVRRNTTEAGFGLGLAIAKQAIDAHGGTIQVRNFLGKGCMFVVELPLGN